VKSNDLIVKKLKRSGLFNFLYHLFRSGGPVASGAARNFVREGPITDVVIVQFLAILHKDHFYVAAQFLVCYNKK